MSLRPVWSTVRQVGAAGVDLVLPRRCAGCRAPGTGLCLRCLDELAAAAPRRAVPEPCPPGFPRTWAAGPYDDVVRGLLLGHKERGQLALVAPLGRLLARAVDGLGAGHVVLVPVPSSRAAVRARGHDHALRLARRAAAEAGLQAAALLHPTRVVCDQAGLDAAGRAANLSGALRATPASTGLRVTGLEVVVVDDVVTTGATLVEAARALREAGARVRGAAVVAAVRRRT